MKKISLLKIANKQMKLLTLTLTIMLLGKLSMAQNPDIIWSKIYGGSEDDNTFSMHVTSDKGYIVCGITQSDDRDISYFILSTEVPLHHENFSSVDSEIFTDF